MARIADSMPTCVAEGQRASQADLASDRLASVGYCSSKDTFFYGVKLHLVVERRPDRLPVPERAGLTPGSENAPRDWIVSNPSARVADNRRRGLCGDRAYCDGPLKERFTEEQHLDLLTPVNKEKGQKPLPAADKLFSEAVSRILPADRVAFQLDQRENRHPTGLEGTLIPRSACPCLWSARRRDASSRSQPLIRIPETVSTPKACFSSAIRASSSILRNVLPCSRRTPRILRCGLRLPQ